jgi:fructoselysine-6-P-deglycase FrlB-like protein
MLDYEQISKVDCLCDAENVYCFGQGNSSIIAMDAWGRFATITSKFHWISDFHMQAVTAATLGANDVILYFSFSGAIRELSELGQLMQKTQAKLILVTRFPKSPGAKYADLLSSAARRARTNRLVGKDGAVVYHRCSFSRLAKILKTQKTERTLNATLHVLDAKCDSKSRRSFFMNSRTSSILTAPRPGGILPLSQELHSSYSCPVA